MLVAAMPMLRRSKPPRDSMISSQLTAWLTARRTRMSRNGNVPSSAGRSVLKTMFQLSVPAAISTLKSSLSSKGCDRSHPRDNVISASSASSAATRLSGSGRTYCSNRAIQGLWTRCVDPASTW